jgi:protein pelota
LLEYSLDRTSWHARSSKLSERQKYVALVESVKEHSGEVKYDVSVLLHCVSLSCRIFSSSHVSGEQLGQMTGVAAILRFPLPELDELDDLEESVAATGSSNPMLVVHMTSFR